MGRMKGAAAMVVGLALAIMTGGLLADAAAPNTTAEDGPDVFNVPSGTSVTLTSSTVVISVPATVPAMVVTCTTFSLAGTTKASLTFATGLPVLTNGNGAPCTDNLGFTDTFSANNTNGSWRLKEQDFTNLGAGDETLAEPNATGDKLSIRLPLAGLIDTNNWPCLLTFAPAAAASVSGKYNDAGMLTVKNAKLPITMSGPAFCGPASQTVTVTATFTVSPALFDQG